MLDVEVQENTTPFSFQEALLKIKNQPELLGNKIKEQMVAKLVMQLNAYIVPFEVVQAYPFFQDKTQLLIGYKDAIIVRYEENSVSVEIDKNVLKRHNLPENLYQLLEFGNELIPPLPHIRPVIYAVNQLGGKML